jgi:STELLO glycosyltransferases
MGQLRPWFVFLFVVFGGGFFLVSDERLMPGIYQMHSGRLKLSVEEQVQEALQELGFDQELQALLASRPMTGAEWKNIILNHDIVASNTTSSIKVVADEIDSNTGRLFKGQRVREVSIERMFSNGWPMTLKPNTNVTTTSDDCDKWGVVTTIFEPTEAVRRVGAMDGGWCLVIVADTKTPSDYLESSGLANNSRVKFLTVQEQDTWGRSSIKGGAFVRAIPVRHFARKNIGYLYAIRNGADFIFDFDDDNIVNLDRDNRIFNIVPTDVDLNNVSIVLTEKRMFNPYPLMKPSESISWPRGFPLEAILDSSTQGIINCTKAVSFDKIGVIQYLADGNPDIDAVHRLTKKLPMTFSPDSNFLLVPLHSFVPYNAQATLHTKPAFWATLLPFTVPGRVSDIWRSYFSEALFREIGLQVVFAPPRVTQERNAHNILADMDAELDLYFKSGKLIEFLDSWRAESVDSLPGLMEKLWIDLCERGYIGENDVTLMQRWLLALVESGYVFPPLHGRLQNVQLNETTDR